MNNKRIGNQFEDDFCAMLYKEGFWVHRLNPNAAGQPADVIAVRNGEVYLIDCKVCSNGYFDLSRVEDNQLLAMGLWETRTGTKPLFAMKMPDGMIYLVPYPVIKEMISKESRIKEYEIPIVGTSYEKWVESA